MSETESENLPETYDDAEEQPETTETDTDAMDDTLDEQIPDPEAGTAADEPGGITGPQDESFDPIELFDHHRHRTNGDETSCC